MKTKNIYQGIALLAMALTTAACQNELNEDTTQPQPGEKVEMTIRATQGMAPQTRTSYTDKLGIAGTDKIEVKWEGGKGGPEEKIQIVGYADGAGDFTNAGTLNSTPSSLSTDGFSITFTGTVTQADKYLAVYPAANSSFDAGYVWFDFFTDVHSQTQDCSNPMAHLKKFDIMIGKSETPSTNNYTFEHKAIMLRFNLTLPTAESVNKITLATTGKGGIAPSAFINKQNVGDKAIDDLKIDPSTVVPEVSLGIKNHNASTTLKAYMMVPYIDVDNATLTITVATNSGNTYEGKLTTVAGTKLTPGLCYTLKPNTTLTNKITIPPVAEGTLGNVLNGFIPDDKQTDLALTGTVNDADIASIVTFLKDPKRANITTLDLSELTNITEVKGLAECPQVTTVILPDNAVAIGDGAFRDCKALTTVTQNDLPEATSETLTRASMPSRVTSVGANAFEGCTAMTEMFLHAKITKVGNYAFKGCTSMKALVFEGTKAVGIEAANIILGTDILAGCTQESLNILLPVIKDVKVAATYKKALSKPTYYEYNGDYNNPATPGDKVKSTSYKASVPDGSGLVDIGPGGNWGN